MGGLTERIKMAWNRYKSGEDQYDMAKQEDVAMLGCLAQAMKNIERLEGQSHE